VEIIENRVNVLRRISRLVREVAFLVEGTAGGGGGGGGGGGDGSDGGGGDGGGGGGGYRSRRSGKRKENRSRAHASASDTPTTPICSVLRGPLRVVCRSLPFISVSDLASVSRPPARASHPFVQLPIFRPATVHSFSVLTKRRERFSRVSRSRESRA